MKAKLENGIINVYNDRNILIGGIKGQPNFKNAQINIGEKTFELSRGKLNSNITENGNVIYNLKSNSFSVNTKILETERSITGVLGLKWGTKMMDKQKNTLIKIRNESKFLNKNKYEIEISDNNVTELEILTSLHAHIYGSNMKTQALMIGVIGGIGAMMFFT